MRESRTYGFVRGALSDRRPYRDPSSPALRRWIAAEPGLTLEQLRERLAEQGIVIKIGALWHQLNKWNLSLKKTYTPASKSAGTSAGEARMA